MSKAAEILEYLLPFVAKAGAYSVAVQERVTTHASKGGPTLFHEALSDADLTIQGYLEVALLGQYPGVSFFSEEQSQSLNAKYFPPAAELEVLLDPIDGTRAYIAQRAQYQIIVTIHDTQSIVGVLCYQPRLDRCYLAVRGSGAYVRTHQECQSGQPGTRLDVTTATGPVLVFDRPDLVDKLGGTFDVRDLATEFDSQSIEGRHYSTDLLTQRASCVISAPAQAIDGGALAFVASEAGAVVSDELGKELGSFRTTSERTLRCVIASANAMFHQEVLRLL